MDDTLDKKPAPDPVRGRLITWFNTPPGNFLLECEQDMLDKILPKLFGYHIMQLGMLSTDGFLRSTPISHRILVQIEDEGPLNSTASMQCISDSLPVAADSIDVVILPHVLEYAHNPHRLLREVERVLIGEGHLVITGFNPWSLWGIWRLFLAWREEPPWSGHFFSFGRIKDWFSLLDFEIVRVERSFYRPPLGNLQIMEKLGFLEKLGNYCWSVLGGVYIIVVKKRVIPLTPVKLRWHQRRNMIASGFAEPTAYSPEEDPLWHR